MSEPACTVCERPYAQRNSLQRVCSPKCAIRSVRAQKAAERADHKRRKEAAKSRPEVAKECEREFNRWIKLRDAHEGCVSCGTHAGRMTAGHYQSVGAHPELRFDPYNVHKQCTACNLYLHGNLISYRTELLRRIGRHEVERLEGPQPARKLTIADLRQLRDEYRAKVKGME